MEVKDQFAVCSQKGKVKILMKQNLPIIIWSWWAWYTDTEASLASLDCNSLTPASHPNPF